MSLNWEKTDTENSARNNNGLLYCFSAEMQLLDPKDGGDGHNDFGMLWKRTFELQCDYKS